MDLTENQQAWFDVHPNHRPVGKPRTGVRFADCGTLYADGSFEPMAPMKPVRLRDGCICVGIPR